MEGNVHRQWSQFLHKFFFALFSEISVLFRPWSKEEICSFGWKRNCEFKVTSTLSPWAQSCTHALTANDFGNSHAINNKMSRSNNGGMQWIWRHSVLSRMKWTHSLSALQKLWRLLFCCHSMGIDLRAIVIIATNDLAFHLLALSCNALSWSTQTSMIPNSTIAFWCLKAANENSCKWTFYDIFSRVYSTTLERGDGADEDMCRLFAAGLLCFGLTKSDSNWKCCSDSAITWCLFPVAMLDDPSTIAAHWRPSPPQGVNW